jgi:hypothetical protein
MEWTILDQDTCIRIVETEALLELKESIKDRQCKVGIANCDPYFWLTTEERRNLRGPIGLIGGGGPKGDSRPFAIPKKIRVDIRFILSNVQAEKIVLKKLSTTVNYVGESLQTWTVVKLTESVAYNCGVYKREEFDEAFRALNRLKPQLTELKFAKSNYDGYEYWDSDLVETRLFDGMDGCLQTTISYDRIETGKSQVTLSLLEVDILENLDYIKHILVPQPK